MLELQDRHACLEDRKRLEMGSHDTLATCNPGQGQSSPRPGDGSLLERRARVQSSYVVSSQGPFYQVGNWCRALNWALICFHPIS